MPSFDAPLEITTRPSRRLLAWQSLVSSAALVACLVSLPAAWRLAGPAAALLPLAAAAIVARALCQLWAAFLRAGDAHGRLILAADGCLAGVTEDGRRIEARVGEVSTLPGIVALHFAAAAATAWPCSDGRRCLFLACDGVDGDAWRRLNAWARHGLPELAKEDDAVAVRGAR